MKRVEFARNTGIALTGGLLVMPYLSKFTSANATFNQSNEIVNVQVGDVKIHSLNHLSNNKMKSILKKLMLFALVASSTSCQVIKSVKTPMPKIEVAERPQIHYMNFKVNGTKGKVWAVPTGLITIKGCHRNICSADDKGYFGRFLDVIKDKEIADPMPIWTFVIQHPEGNYIIDTGGDQNWSDEESWECDKRGGLVSRSMAYVDVEDGEFITDRLKQIGISNIDAAFITHLHWDHTAGINALKVPTYSGRGDIENANVIGSVPCRFYDYQYLVDADSLIEGKGMKPSSQKLQEAIGDYYPVTSDKAFKMFSTPGHTPGSLTFNLETEKIDFWFVGDITFEMNEIGPESSTAGIHVFMDKIRDQHAFLRHLRDEEQPLTRVFLPAHSQQLPSNFKLYKN